MAQKSDMPAFEGHTEISPRTLEWIEGKHARLRRYIEGSAPLRRQFVGQGGVGATLIDLYCTPPRLQARGSSQLIEGSAVFAQRIAEAQGSAFSALHLGSTEPKALADNESLLKRAGASVRAYRGSIDQTLPVMIAGLNKRALHFILLDPPNLQGLPLTLIQDLAILPRLHLLIHLNAGDLQRHLGRYLGSRQCVLDSFAPGWREVVTDSAPLHQIRLQILEHWLKLLRPLGFAGVHGDELIGGTQSRSICWLALAARPAVSPEFWDLLRGEPRGP
jgi:three-Cys-motif partner protein